MPKVLLSFTNPLISMRKLLTFFISFIATATFVTAQQTFPVNGLRDNRHITYAFINAKLHVDYKTVIDSATFVVKDGIIVDAGKNISLPADASVMDLKGKHIYPSFIDLFSDYGIEELKTKAKEGQQPQFLSNTKGAYGWNQAIRPEIDAYKHFVADNKKAEELRNVGFGAVLSFNKDGIVRGSGVMVNLADANENELIIKDKAAAGLSFDKGSSTQDYPSSKMGCIALIRQTYLDAEWYRTNDKEFNISLDAFNNLKSLPQIFDVNDKLDALRAVKIANEFNTKYIIKGSGDEYQRINEIKNTAASFIIPVNFPDAFDVADPYDAINVSLAQMKHWELAPANAMYLDKAGINFSFTLAGIKEKKDFLKNIRKAIDNGLSEDAALKALTISPAAMIGLENKLGSLQKGKIANFIITSKKIFDKENVIYENWTMGKRNVVKNMDPKDIRGNYSMTINNESKTVIKIQGETELLTATVIEDTNKTNATIVGTSKQFALQYESKKISRKGMVRLSGNFDNTLNKLTGTGQLPDGSWFNWVATFDSAYIAPAKIDSSAKDKKPLGEVWYPQVGYGWKEIPKQKNVLIKNATVWTNEKEGIQQNTDVLIGNGKIIKVGKNISATTLPNVETIDGTGKHISAGIIDEHSHIAISGDVNECTQAVTAEVRIGDVVDCDDLQIYRQLSGGVTCSHLLHGSCNPVGGQTQLIKLRWGLVPEEMKVKSWDGFIKFALGENVKQSNWGDNNRIRYPQTRMGVEQVYMDAFTRAKEYSPLTPKGGIKEPVRRDLELEALKEILDKKRFITCHSYVQSEINMLMHVADTFGFRVNTFTHILEGYKVADKMKKHGVGASSFADWWAYKFEVYEAIPYNPKILHDVGVTVAINSDDAEMARRLNQEAAKAITYGNVSQEEALKFVTLNPAKLLHVDDRMGSIKEGKDADVVLWSDNPLSVYARVLQTYVDGIKYYDVNDDEQKRTVNEKERARLIQKMLDAKAKGERTKKVSMIMREEKHCNEEERPKAP